MADTLLYVQNQPSYLDGAGALLGDTTLVLRTFIQIDGTALAMTDFGTVGFGTIEPNSGTQEEQISFTGITQNSNGTATLTGVKTVLMIAPYTQTSGLAITHPGGAKFVISNTAGFYDKMTSKSNDETITGVYTFTNPNVPRMDTAHTYGAGEEEYFSTKRYADSLAIAGAPDASLTQKGLVEEATAAEITAGTQIGLTLAELAMNPKYYKDSYYPQSVITTAYTYGEDITSGQALYVKATDGKAYKASGATDAEASNSFIGIALDSGLANSTGNRIQISGLVSGLGYVFASIGNIYLSDTAGDISSTPGTYKKMIGFAPSTSTLVINIVYSAANIAGSNSNTTTANFNESMTFFSGTDITGNEAEILSAGGNDADALHTHGFYSYLIGVGNSAAKTYWNFVLPFNSMTSGATEIFTLVNVNVLSGVNLEYAPTAGGANSFITNQRVFPSYNFNDTKDMLVEFGAIFSSVGTDQMGFGLVETIAPTADYDDQTVDAACFTVDSAGVLYAHTSDNSVGHTEVAIAGITLTNLNTYRIEFNPGVNAKFYVNGVLKATITTNLPNSANVKFAVGSGGNTNYPTGVIQPTFSVEK